MKPKLISQFDDTIPHPNPTGDGFEPVFDYVVNKETGEVVYKEVGKTNMYELIQASKDGTDIHYIAERMAKGDNSLLNVKKGYFLDTSELPKDVFELEEMAKTIRGTYNSDAILQQIYPSYEEYEKAFMKGEVFDAYMKAVSPKQEGKPEVKEDGNNEIESK